MSAKQRFGSEWRLALLVLALVLVTVQCKPGAPVELPSTPVPCAQCNMTIVDARFAVQVHTNKGRVLFFDSIECARRFVSEHPEQSARIYFRTFLDPPRWIEGRQVWLLRWAGIRSPMGGNWAAFASEEEARAWLQSLGVSPSDFTLARWNDVRH